MLRGEGERERFRWLEEPLLERSKGEGDLDTAGVDRGDSSLMSQYSSLMSGVDCLLLGFSFSELLSRLSAESPISLFRVFLGNKMLKESQIP